MKENQPSRNSIIRYFNGKCTSSEKVLVELYLAMEVDTDYVESCIEEAFEKHMLENNPLINEELKAEAWQKFLLKKSTLSQNKPNQFNRIILYAASILLFIIGSWAIYHFAILNNKEQSTFYLADIGNKKEYTLPDHSKIVLFPGSKLEVPEKFNQAHRQVKLIGKAYFEVAHDAKKPFIVSTNELDTKVLGTTFEINGNSKIQSIILKSGRVSVIRENQELAILEPNQRLVFDKETKLFTIEHVAAESSLDWVNGELNYDMCAFKEICQDLEKWYNVKINIQNPELENKKITTSFKDLPIEKVMNILSIGIGFKYTIHANHINIF